MKYILLLLCDLATAKTQKAKCRYGTIKSCCSWIWTLLMEFRFSLALAVEIYGTKIANSRHIIGYKFQLR